MAGCHLVVMQGAAGARKLERLQLQQLRNYWCCWCVLRLKMESGKYFICSLYYEHQSGHVYSILQYVIFTQETSRCEDESLNDSQCL